MSDSDELISILERILSGDRDEAAIAQLRQGLKMVGDILQHVAQDGQNNTNIGKIQGTEVHIGDRLHIDVEVLKKLLECDSNNFDWPQVSREYINKQMVQSLTTNPLTSAENISYQAEKVYIPLGLVERKRLSRRQNNVLPEYGSQLYEEIEIAQEFEHKTFLKEVLYQGKSPRSAGCRIAIIGEPGAGKTTLLQKIARWASKKLDEAIIIWISLADLQNNPLEDYLLEHRLESFARQQGKAKASPQLKDEFVNQFRQSKVWLLLDGVDEMSVSSGSPLSEIERQIKLGGFLSQARIVLTCRLNLWDSNYHTLEMFDTYRTLEFAYPMQVEKFIEKWFDALPEGQEDQAKRLCAELKCLEKSRIQDLVKNPLRLTLLCSNWHSREGILPDTKAELYETFVEDFHEWKRTKFSVSRAQQERLYKALGKLSCAAIDNKEIQFCLPHKFICRFLGQPDEDESFFRLALRLGWLNRIGVESKNHKKAVYAFLHPTFQEYFAAHYITANYNIISCSETAEKIAVNIYKERWAEVFMLIAEKLEDSNLLVYSMQISLSLLLKNSSNIQRFFHTINQKALPEVSVGNNQEKSNAAIEENHTRLQASIRAFYCANALSHSLNLNTPNKDASDSVVSLLNVLEPNFSLDKLLTIAIGLDDTFNTSNDIVIDRALTSFLALALDLNKKNTLEANFIHTSLLSRVLESHLEDFLDNEPLSINLDPELKQSLEVLRQELTKLNSLSTEEVQEWWKLSGIEWIDSLSKILTNYRKIKYDWSFDEDELKLLESYFKGSKLLVQYLDRSSNIDLKTQENVQREILLPISNL